MCSSLSQSCKMKQLSFPPIIWRVVYSCSPSYRHSKKCLASSFRAVPSVARGVRSMKDYAPISAHSLKHSLQKDTVWKQHSLGNSVSRDFISGRKSRHLFLEEWNRPDGSSDPVNMFLMTETFSPDSHVMTLLQLNLNSTVSDLVSGPSSTQHKADGWTGTLCEIQTEILLMQRYLLRKMHRRFSKQNQVNGRQSQMVNARTINSLENIEVASLSNDPLDLLSHESLR